MQYSISFRNVVLNPFFREHSKLAPIYNQERNILRNKFIADRVASASLRGP